MSIKICEPDVDLCARYMCADCPQARECVKSPFYQKPMTDGEKGLGILIAMMGAALGEAWQYFDDFETTDYE